MAQTTIAGKFLDPTVISALDAITDGASASDFLLVWDASDSTLKKLLPDNLGLGAATIKTTYASHGLAVGDVVKPSGTDNQYNKALATTAANAEVVGIVTAVSGNAVTITISGEISTGAVSGFDYADATAGTILFLSATAGLLTSTEPTTEGQISKPVAIVTQDDAKIVLIIQRGEVIGTGVQTDAPNDATYLTTTANGTLTAEVVVGTAPGGELGGSWASPTVDGTHSGSAHHADAHSVVSHNDTSITGAELTQLSGISANVTDTNLNILTDSSSTTALHVHAGTALQSTVINGNRPAATASNSSVPYTGAGFAPSAVLVMAQGNTQDNFSMGWGEDSGATRTLAIKTMNGTHVMTLHSVGTVIIEGVSGSNSQVASLVSLDSDGITLSWVKSGSGESTNFAIVFMR